MKQNKLLGGPGRVITIGFKDTLPSDFIEINCTSRSTTKWRELSPFMNRPIKTPDGLIAQNLENLWQFSKVYSHYLDEDGVIKPQFYQWRAKGFADTFAHRYPMGKGIKPEFMLWGDQRLSYVQARREVYFPKYKETVKDTKIFQELNTLHQEGANLAIRDFDVYRFDPEKISIDEIIDNPYKKAGHGFALYHMLIDQ